ncbi:hypothetical protein HDU98_009356 [Podochytrium sp. JEL0797]|nr:hypothetical protein HDU98_009356 [Podochytrium sp. JEL0797]
MRDAPVTASLPPTIHTSALKSSRRLSLSLVSRIQQFESPTTSLPAPLPSPPKIKTTRRLSYIDQVSSEPIDIDPGVSLRRTSLASRRESLTREQFQDSLPTPVLTSISPAIAETIEALRDTVLSSSQQTDYVYLPPTPTGPDYSPDRCTQCDKHVSAATRVVHASLPFHEACFKCKQCRRALNPGKDVVFADKELFCKIHYNPLGMMEASKNGVVGHVGMPLLSSAWHHDRHDLKHVHFS